MKIIRELNSDDLITIVRDHFRVPTADINIKFITKTVGYGRDEEEQEDIIMSIEEESIV